MERTANPVSSPASPVVAFRILSAPPALSSIALPLGHWRCSRLTRYAPPNSLSRRSQTWAFLSRRHLSGDAIRFEGTHVPAGHGVIGIQFQHPAPPGKCSFAATVDFVLIRGLYQPVDVVGLDTTLGGTEILVGWIGAQPLFDVSVGRFEVRCGFGRFRLFQRDGGGIVLDAWFDGLGPFGRRWRQCDGCDTYVATGPRNADLNPLGQIARDLDVVVSREGNEVFPVFQASKSSSSSSKQWSSPP